MTSTSAIESGLQDVEAAFALTVIDEAATYCAGNDVVSRSRAIDMLLDVRNAFTGAPEVTSAVDQALCTMPGVTMVTGRWMTEALAYLRAMVAR